MMRHILLLLLSLCLFACSSQPTYYYLLKPEQAINPLQNNKIVHVGLGPINLPDYLDRITITNYINDNQLDINDQYQWSQPLKSNIHYVLTSELKQWLNTPYIEAYPWHARTRIDYQVTINFERFDCEHMRQCVLQADWQIGDKTQKMIYTIEKTHIVENIEDESYAAIVRALNKTLHQLSQQIARQIIRLTD